MLRVFEAFAGVGSQRMALRNLGIDHEVVAIAEIDKFAIASYNAIHGETLNLGDISQMNAADIPDHDLFTYSFPCQDISIAGKQAGLDLNSGTRSGLLWECQKVIATKKPKYLLLENVKNLVGKRHKANFDLWLEWLVSQGYSNYWQVLNAKDYGVPQNRERVFVVSILGDDKEFHFPEKQDLSIRLKDLLEDSVDEKYYLKSERAKQLVRKITDDNNVLETVTVDATVVSPKIKDISNCITARYDAGIQNKPSIGMSVIEPKIPIKNATRKGYLEATPGDGIDLAYPNSSTRRGRVQKECSPTLQTADTVGTVEIINPLKGKTHYGWHFEQAVYAEDSIVRTVKAGGGSGNIPKVIEPYRIRKLTPLECWRLMGFTDQDFYKAQEVNSNSQLYKQAGNSIVVPVLEGIFSQLFINNKQQLAEVA